MCIKFWGSRTYQSFLVNKLNQLLNTSPTHVPKAAFYRDIVGMCIKFWGFPESIKVSWLLLHTPDVSVTTATVYYVNCIWKKLLNQCREVKNQHIQIPL